MTERTEWRIVLTKGATSGTHAKGLKVCKRIDRAYSDGEQLEPYYKYGDFGYTAENILMEWPLFSMQTEWHEFVQPYRPTLKEKILVRLFRKEYPKTVKVRPADDTLVITGYLSDHYEMAEYSNRCWITNLCFPAEPKRWCYVPKECIEAAEKAIRKGV